MCIYTFISLYLYIHACLHLNHTCSYTHVRYFYVLPYTCTYACTHLSLTSWGPMDQGSIQAKRSGSWERQIGGAMGWAECPQWRAYFLEAAQEASGQGPG